MFDFKSSVEPLRNTDLDFKESGKFNFSVFHTVTISILSEKNPSQLNIWRE
jgi:hypothetical protein